MDKAVILAFLKKTAYAVIANVVAALMLGLSGHAPSGNPLELQIYMAVASLLTGIVAALKRWSDKNLNDAPAEPQP